jgi:hypothetical protein
MIKVLSSTGVSGITGKTTMSPRPARKPFSQTIQSSANNESFDRWTRAVRRAAGNKEIMYLNFEDPTDAMFDIFVEDVGQIICELGGDHILRCRWANSDESYGEFTTPAKLFDSLKDYKRRLREARNAAEAEVWDD